MDMKQSVDQLLKDGPGEALVQWNSTPRFQKGDEIRSLCLLHEQVYVVVVLPGSNGGADPRMVEDQTGFDLVRDTVRTIVLRSLGYGLHGESFAVAVLDQRYDPRRSSAENLDHSERVQWGTLI